MECETVSVFSSVEEFCTLSFSDHLSGREHINLFYCKQWFWHTDKALGGHPWGQRACLETWIAACYHTTHSSVCRGVGEITEAQTTSVGSAASQHSVISLGPLRIFAQVPRGFFFREPGTGAFEKPGMWRRELVAGLIKRAILVF